MHRLNPLNSLGRLSAWAAALVVSVVLLAMPGEGAVLLSNLVSFGSTNGAFPYAGLVQATNGLFYGTTVGGGAAGNGTVFALSPSGTLTTVASFGGLDMNPYSPLLEASDGNLYGTLSAAGPDGFGAVFRLTSLGVLTNFALFTADSGYAPESGLVQGQDGNLYGTTVYGGSYSLGTVYKLTPAGLLTALVSFDGTNGANPYAALVPGGDGNFYGTATYGGAYNLGTIFQVTPAGLLTMLVTFDGTNGANPRAGLLLGSDGYFYGAASRGGTYNLGTVFRLTPAGSLTNLVSFDGTNGALPYATLVEAADGNFYGTTYGTAPTGVTDYYGSVYRFTGAGALEQVLAFDGAGGASSFSSLVQGSDGALYGTAWSGGAFSMGSLYRLTELPYFLDQPLNQTNPPGGSVTFVASAAGGFGPLSYQWQKDSTPLTNSARVFGATTDTLSITNLTDADQGLYWLVASNSFGAVASSNAFLRVMYPDTVSPTLAINSPAPNSNVSNAVVIVFGVASDDVAVAAVYYQVNSGAWTLASTNDGWAAWSATATLLPGTNVFAAYSQDTSGNVSPTSTQVISYIPSALLTVLIQGSGTVSPDLDGQFLALGYSYTLAAQPAPGFVFSNWTGSISSSDSVLTFVMESNLVLQANFVAGSLTPVPGTYNGLFFPAAGISPTNSGLFTLQLTPQGRFSAKARFASGQASFTGQFSGGEGKARGIPPGQELATLALDLLLDAAPAGTRVTGTLSDGIYTANVSAWLAGPGPAAPARGRKLYTLALPPATNAPAAPGGWGALTARLNSRGAFTLAGRLGDGAWVGQSVLVATNGNFPLFAPLTGGKGMLLGWLDLTGDAPHGDRLSWIEPPGASGRSFYPDGFAVTTSLLGSPYAPPTRGANALPLTNGLLVLLGGNLPQGSLTNALALVNNQAVLKSNPNRLALEFFPGTGVLRGSFTLPGARARTRFVGVALQNQTAAFGSFQGTNQAGEVLFLRQ